MPRPEPDIIMRAVKLLLVVVIHDWSEHTKEDHYILLKVSQS